jgi:hypothetical protein
LTSIRFTNRRLDMKNTIQLAAVAILLAIVSQGCGRDDTGGLAPAAANTDPVVFDDNYGDYTTFQAFLNTKVDAVQIDTQVAHESAASLRVTVPDPDPVEWFAGGAFTTDRVRDLSGYNALTFWARANKLATLNVAGLGNDNTGTSKYMAEANDLELTTAWEKYVIPIPLAAKLKNERGLFYIAEGHENDQGYVFWLDDIKFEYLDNISNPRPTMPDETMTTFVGAKVVMEGTETVFDIGGGTDQTVVHQPGYFTFTSSNDTVAAVVNGEIQIVGDGSAEITAKLGDVDVVGKATLQCLMPPSTPAPTPPARDSGDVISLFSNAYSDIDVIHWVAYWDYSNAKVADIQVGGDDVKAYWDLNFAGIEWTQPPNHAAMTIDASEMTHFHMDIWVPEGNTFKIEIVDFGEDGAPYGAPDFIGVFEIPHTLYPQLETGTWVSVDVPLAEFTGLYAQSHLAQLVISTPDFSATVVYVDNVYFYKSTVAAKQD